MRKCCEIDFQLLLLCCININAARHAIRARGRAQPIQDFVQQIAVPVMARLQARPQCNRISEGYCRLHHTVVACGTGPKERRCPGVS